MATFSAIYLHVVCNGNDIEPDVEVTYLGVLWFRFWLLVGT